MVSFSSTGLFREKAVSTSIRALSAPARILIAATLCILLLSHAPRATAINPPYVAPTWYYLSDSFGDDPYPYGFEINRAALEKLVTYSTEQGLTKTRAVLEELFAAETLTT